VKRIQFLVVRKNDFNSSGIPGVRPRTMLALYFTGVHCGQSGFSSRWRKRLRRPEWTLQPGLERPFWFELLPHGSCQPQTDMDTEENWKSTMLAFTYENIPQFRRAKIIFPSGIRKSNLRQWTMLALYFFRFPTCPFRFGGNSYHEVKAEIKMDTPNPFGASILILGNAYASDWKTHPPQNGHMKSTMLALCVDGAGFFSVAVEHFTRAVKIQALFRCKC